MSKKGLLIAGIVVIAAAVAVALWARRAYFQGADAEDSKLVALGEKIYGDKCAACHGIDLEGQPDWRQRLADGTLPAPPHDQSGHTWHHSDRVLFEYVKHGGEAQAVAGFKSNMQGFAGELSDREIWAALAYIKSRWPPEIRARQQRMNRGG